jgi:predicted nucleic acid-binding protein
VTVLLDSTVLTNFSRVNRPDLVLHAFLVPIATTEPTWNELEVAFALGLLTECDWSWLSVVPLTAEEQITFSRLAANLGAGESACLAIAQHRGWSVATDDMEARRFAAESNIPVTGTLGILTQLVRRGHLSLEEADDLLTEMIRQGYRSPVSTLESLIE